MFWGLQIENELFGLRVKATMYPLSFAILTGNLKATLTSPMQWHTVHFNVEVTVMPQFVTLVRYTQQGISKIKESPSRFDAAKKAAEAVGGKVLAWYLTMGRYDAVLISEFPTDEACAKFTLSAGQLGNISTETMKAFPEQEYREIIGSLP
jgi:uncharacterized protein with GYD domain